MSATERSGLAAAAVLALLGPALARAQVSTTAGASLLVWPKVIVEGERNTVIHLTNLSNQTATVRCFYSGTDRNSNAVTVAIPLLTLTRQQPTHWIASQGRPVDNTDPQCAPDRSSCTGAGLDPGEIPAIGTSDFFGELRCVQVDVSGAPFSGNALTGSATLVDLEVGDVTKYDAIGFAGLEGNDGDDVLCLGGTVSDGCPSGAEYAGCPASWSLNHAPQQSTGVGADLNVDTWLTATPCAWRPPGEPLIVVVDIGFLITNQFEQTFEASTSITGWADAPLGGAFSQETLGGEAVRTTATSAAGVLLLAEETRLWPRYGVSAFNLHHSGERSGGDLIVLPPVGM